CPQLTILATSREALGIGGERPWLVPSLSLPDPGTPANAEQTLACEAVRLFVERARVVRPDFTPTAENAALVARICRRLDGIPLALELAAARLAALSLESLGARLDDRFRLLTGGSRTALPRQQTLRATLDWSHDLLSEPERVLFRRLSVFAGGWTLETAEDVCAGESIEPGDVLDLLAGLLGKSLALLEERSGERRYRLLETVRQYGSEKLSAAGEAALLRDRHLDWCLAMARRMELWVDSVEPGPSNLESHEQAAGLEQCEVEADNLRAALAWSSAADGRLEKGLHLAASTHLWWYLGGHAGEGRRWLGMLLQRDGKLPALLEARALLSQSFLAWSQGAYAEGMRSAETAHALFTREGNQVGAISARYNQGVQALHLGDYPRATEIVEEVLRAYRDLGDRKGTPY
ncbi:MAG: ATP-binding protein, partial [Chloroflexota bacterium]